MPVSVITPPAPIVSFEDADAQLRLDGDTTEQAYVEGLIAAATGWLDGPAGWLGRALGEQTLELQADRFTCDLVRLPCPPLISLSSVKYIDDDGVLQTLAADQYALTANGVRLAYGQSWPTSRTEADAVRIRYVAGYPDGEVPAPIKHAILLLVGQWFAAREAVGKSDQAELPFAVSALLSPYRVWAI